MKLTSAAACAVIAVAALLPGSSYAVAATNPGSGSSWTEQHKVGHDTVTLKYQYSQKDGVPALAVTILVLGSRDPAPKRPDPPPKPLKPPKLVSHQHHCHPRWRIIKVNTGFGGAASSVARHFPRG